MNRIVTLSYCCFIFISLFSMELSDKLSFNQLPTEIKTEIIKKFCVKHLNIPNSMKDFNTARLVCTEWNGIADILREDYAKENKLSLQQLKQCVWYAQLVDIRPRLGGLLQAAGMIFLPMNKLPYKKNRYTETIFIDDEI